MDQNFINATKLPNPAFIFVFADCLAAKAGISEGNEYHLA
jgi:hypothetical protein